jgi:hypothetical protein
MKHIPLFEYRPKKTYSQNDKMVSKAILEFDRLESVLIRLKNLSIMGRDRTKISDLEKRAKMEGYIQAFGYAADLVGKAKKIYERK